MIGIFRSRKQLGAKDTSVPEVIRPYFDYTHINRDTGGQLRTVQRSTHRLGAGLRVKHSNTNMGRLGLDLSKKRDFIATARVPMSGYLRFDGEDFDVKAGQC